jgi:polar amino acid transport system substrate-binding protein
MSAGCRNNGTSPCFGAFSQVLGCLCIFVAVLFAHCDRNKHVADTIIFGTCADYPPFEFLEKGQVAGFEIDLAKCVAQKIGKKAEFKNVDFGALLACLNNKSIDIAVSALNETEERKKNFLFTKPHYYSGMTLVYRKKEPIESKEQMIHKKVGVQIGSTMEQWAKTAVPDTEKMIAFDTVNQGVESLKAQSIDVFVMEKPIAREFCRINADLGFADLEDDVYRSQGMSFVLPQGREEMKQKVDEIVQEMANSGELNNLKKQWNLE